MIAVEHNFMLILNSYFCFIPQFLFLLGRIGQNQPLSISFTFVFIRSNLKCRGVVWGVFGNTQKLRNYKKLLNIKTQTGVTIDYIGLLFISTLLS